ncbi:MAG TPA: hypothetical protein VF574_12090 [Allosphingosinicella sp.]|jgi:type IV secretion system protein VirB10
MSDAPRETAPPPPKENPETLVLRGSPRPVVRFRRGLIIGITGAVAAALVTVTWVALAPPSFRIAAGEDQGAEPLAKAAPEALADAPASYGDVPRLGPPLPGDLGRPILEHQRSLGGGASPPAAQAAPSEAEAARPPRNRSASVGPRPRKPPALRAWSCRLPDAAGPVLPRYPR